MDPDQLFQRYQELQSYVGWTEEDARRVQALAPLLEPYVTPLIDDFYEEIDRHPQARKVITGGAAQIQRLKKSLRAWVRDLLTGPYDKDYVTRRWKVGTRHVEIGLDQVYTNMALSRLRRGLLCAMEDCLKDDIPAALAARRSLNTLLDLDLAKIEDAYQSEYLAREQRNERLAAIGQIAGNIAHELRNPLNVVKTSVYYLLNARNLTAEKKLEHLQRIERHVTVADGVITALNNFARLPVPNLQRFSVGPCILEALEINPVPASVHVAVDCTPNLQVQGDADQLRIVFGNLIRNAREAMPEGGSLTISARPVGEEVEVAVADTGIGITPEHQQRIMEPLYSTKARGLGLGLAMVRSILEKNRGHLRFVSEPGRGTTFTVSLST